ncbi:MAG: hypothetical protein ABUS47_00390 [Steroidobacter sp.]
MNDHDEEVNMGSTIWQSQQVEAPRISLEFVRHYSEKRRRSLKNERNMFYLVVAAAFAYWSVSTFRHGFVIGEGPMEIVYSISTLLFSLVVVCMVLHMHKHVRMKSPSADADVAGGLAAYRSELERLLQISRREWQVLLYVSPSYFTLLIGGLIFDQHPGKLMRYGALIAAGIASACFGFWVGRKKSGCLQRELDAIASLK